VKHFTLSDWWWSYHGADPEREAPMLEPEDFNSENYRICWPAILAVFAVQMIVLITLSIAVANHSSFTTASSTDVEAKAPKKVRNCPKQSELAGSFSLTAIGPNAHSCDVRK
jgi:hypothetical protein